MKRKSLITKLNILVLLLVGFIGLSYSKDVFAASVSVKEINYIDSTVTVQMGAEDTLLFISDSKQKKWDCVPVEKDENDQIVFDISWVSMSKSYVMSFKGDISDTPVTATFAKQVTNFKATYSALDGGSIKFTNDGNRKIQWKKKDAFKWSDMPADLKAFSNTLNALSSNGAILAFRLAPVNGDGKKPGERASKEVYVAIKKKAAAPVIKIDDSKMAISVLKGMEYRLCDKDGNPESDTWTAFTKTELKPLSEIAGKSLIDKQNKTTPEATYIQFRMAATSTAPVSNIATITIPAQVDMPSDILDKAKIEYSSKTSFKISVNVATALNPYEYCIINQDDIKDGITINDYKKITWKTLNSSSAVTVNQSEDKVKDGSLVYIRRKAQKSLGDEEYKLASPWILLGTVSYPGDISTEGGKLTWLTSTVGVCNPDNTDGNLTFTMYSPVNSPIKEIKFYKFDRSGQVGESLKLKEQFRCSVDKNSAAGGDSDKAYIITTTIFDTSKIDSAIKSNEDVKLLANMKLDSSMSEFESDVDKGGIALCLHPKTVINNPVSNDSKRKTAAELVKGGNSTWSSYNPEKDFAAFTTNFTRIYLSNNKYTAGMTNLSLVDPHQFRVRLDIGTRFVPDKTSEGQFTNKKVEVTKIKYDGVEMAAGSEYFNVYYADIVDDNKSGWNKRMAVVEFNVDKIEKIAAITARDEEKPVTIYLSNGEIISDIKLMLKSTVTPKNGPVAISFTEGSIAEVETTTTTSPDGNKTTTEKKADDKYSMTFKVFDANYNVTCTAATWKGHDICADVHSTEGGVTVVFSNSKLNRITETGSDFVKFTFDNGFETSVGCKIIILKK